MSEREVFSSNLVARNIDEAWSEFIKNTTVDRSTWEAFQYAWVAAGASDPTWEQLKGQCQAIWRTDVTLVCQLPKGHQGAHHCGRHTFNGEVDVKAIRPNETTTRLQMAFQLLNAATYYVPRPRKLHADIVAWLKDATATEASPEETTATVEDRVTTEDIRVGVTIFKAGCQVQTVLSRIYRGLNPMERVAEEASKP
jgi:hypothetical protein